MVHPLTENDPPAFSNGPFRSLAIAGAWGYIGRKFLDAARGLEIAVTVYDPGPVPDDVELTGVAVLGHAAEFYQRPADLFHLALHPEHRGAGVATLLARSAHEPIRILCEKPMAVPERPQDCLAMVQAVEASGATVLYDFPELFDPITQRIGEFLARFRDVTITSVDAQRSKDREDPANPRNYKRMVSIEYQESVHCLAFVLHLLRAVRGGMEAVFDAGLSVTAAARPYVPPNPDVYPAVVDGRCAYRLQLGATTVRGLTDFKRGAPWTKRRIIRGQADGQPFTIDADYLEGAKRLTINGVAQVDCVRTNSYAEVLKTFGAWSQHVPRAELHRGPYPHPRFAHVAYQLSSVLWQSSQTHTPIAVASLESLLAFRSQAAGPLQQLPQEPRV